MINKKNMSQNIQAADIAQKAGFQYGDAELICRIADSIQKTQNYDQTNLLFKTENLAKEE